MSYRSVPYTMRGAFRPSWIFLAMVGLTIFGGAMAWYGTVNVGLAVFVFVVAGWVVSLCLHEYGHALTAFRGGDHSVASRGYLTLNPLKYAHPILSIVLPLLFLVLGGIGLPGGAVWIDRHAIRNKVTNSLISLIGPGMNLVLALLLCVPFGLDLDTAARPQFWAGVAFLAFLQLTAGILNLVPIPGLDGGNAIRPWLTDPWDRRFDLFAPYGMLILFALLWEPRVRYIFFGFVEFISSLIGLDFDLAMYGLNVFRFWS
jgi:Zn-dependent protease